ncbi:MAG TPA: hypothetical protein VGH38_23145 [Bryobacteraceae bacterium]
MSDDLQTLSERLCAGPMNVPEALRLAMQLAGTLRQLHSEGRCHGALTPDSVLLTAGGLELFPAEPGATDVLTPYAAPERFLGHEPDACTDIFAFGAVLYEMLTGFRAFEGGTPEALADSIRCTEPAPIGEPGFGRLVSTCLAKDRAGRWQRMQQIVMELKLLAASTRRTESGAMPRFVRMEASLHSRIEQLEAVLASRLETHGKEVAEMLRTADVEFSKRHAAAMESVSGSLKLLHAQFGDMDREFSDVQVRGDLATQETRQMVASLEAAVASQIRELKEMAVEATSAIEAARSATARTDDLVERVVEALDSLQSMVLDQSEDRTLVAAR